MYRILVVEDNHELYEKELLRFLGKILPMEEVLVEHAPSIEVAISKLQESWEVILMDFFLGAAANYAGPLYDTPRTLRNGSELVTLRREAEKAFELAPATIIGISSVQIGNIKMVEAGANTSQSKKLLEDLALEVKRSLGISG